MQFQRCSPGLHSLRRSCYGCSGNPSLTPQAELKTLRDINLSDTCPQISGNSFTQLRFYTRVPKARPAACLVTQSRSCKKISRESPRIMR
jgi:hypothetical protein